MLIETALALSNLSQNFSAVAWHEIGWHLVWVVVTIVAILVLQLFLHATLDRIVERVVRSHKHSSVSEERKREATLKSVFRVASGVLLWIIGFFVILWELKVNLTPLLTGAGLISVVAGFGAQNLIRDCLAGIFIIMENQLRIDDIVTISTPTATISGSVEEVNIRTTRLRDLDGNLHILTNGAIGVITNRSFKFAQVNIDIYLNYDTDIDLVEKLINKAGLANAGETAYKSDVIEAIQFLRVDALNQDNVVVKALGKVKPGTQWDIAGDFRRKLKKIFDDHHIAAPYDNFVLHQSDSPRSKPAAVRKPKKL